VKTEVTKVLMTVHVPSAEEVAEAEEKARREAEALEARMRLQHALAGPAGEVMEEDESTPAMKPFQQFGKKVGRNEPCPCGSGKKYKHCHGALA